MRALPYGMIANVFSGDWVFQMILTAAGQGIALRGQ